MRYQLGKANSLKAQEDSLVPLARHIYPFRYACRLRALGLRRLPVLVVFSSLGLGTSQAFAYEPVESPVVLADNLTDSVELEGLNNEALGMPIAQGKIPTELDEISPQPMVDFEAQLAEAQQLTWQGDYDSAIAAYEAILAIAPDNLAARSGLAEAYTWSGQAAIALPLYDDILTAYPNYIPAQIGKAQALTWQADFRLALTLYEQVLQIEPNNLSALRGQADLLARLGNYQQATDYFRAAIERYPDSPELKIGLARVYYSRQQTRRAVELLHPLIESGNSEALALLDEIEAVQVELNFENENNNSDRINQLIESTVRFRIDHSDTVQFVSTGFNSFRQNAIEGVDNIPVQVGIEGHLGEVSLSSGVGIDFFDRLPAVPNAFVNATWEASSNLFISGEVQYGAYKFNAETLANDIRALRVTPEIYWRFDEATSLYSSFTWGSYSDGNQEQQFIASAERTFGNFFIGASFFFWNYNQDLDNGYFDPDGYLYYGGEIGWAGPITDTFGCRISASLGAQTLDGRTSGANSYQGKCTSELLSGFEVALGYRYSTIIDDVNRNNSENSTVSGQLRFTF